MATENLEKWEKIPPRWLHCPRRGELVMGKFLPFKTPLSSKYDEQVPLENRFTVDMLFSALKTRRVKMGLWIDLTYTDRFYNRDDVEKYDCKYFKLECRGRDETPSEDQTTAFVKLCEKFISKNPLEIIGVHCTHGFNRTGWLIINYLVQIQDWCVDAAIRTFAVSRPPGIYKQDYMEQLFKTYDDDIYLDAPPLPNWCLESDDTDRDDDGKKIENNKGGKKRNRFNAEAEFMDGSVPAVDVVSNPTQANAIQVTAQNLAGYKGSGFLGLQPVSMDRQNLELLVKQKYKVSWKADGVRYTMLINGKDQVYMFDRNNYVFSVPNLVFPKRKDPGGHLSRTLVDGEMIIDEDRGKKVPRYLIYDIIKYEGLDVGRTDFDRRLLCIEKEIIGARNAAIQDGRLDKTKQPFSVRMKPFWDISMSQQILEGNFSKQVSHETDGLIFQPVDDAYVCGQCPKVLKWKPPDMNSIDFKLKIVQENKMGMLPRKVGYLYVGGLEQAFGEIKMTKELRELNGKIIECYWDVTERQGKWKFMRQRTDKSFPNAFETAKAVIHSIQFPVTKKILFDCIKHVTTQRKDAAQMPPPMKKPRT